jgi:hypothetical protein
MKTFSSLLVVTRKGAKGACRAEYSAASVCQCIGCMSLCLTEGGSYSPLPRKPSGPNLLDELLKDFIMYPAYSPWNCYVSN